jgi:para-aminobenzoate synthetase component 1
LYHPFSFKQLFMQLTEDFKQRAMSWANSFNYCCILDSNGYKDKYGKYDFIVAAGARKSLQANIENAFDRLKAFYNSEPAWMFGLLGYDLKNGIETLQSANLDGIEFPDLFFFLPDTLLISENGELRVEIGDPGLLAVINSYQIVAAEDKSARQIVIQSRFSRTSYLEKVENLKKQIQKGNIYEVTFCQEFFAENTVINPLETFKRLNRVSPMPFAGYLKIKDKFLLCASPERFLRKSNQSLVSQPIKGTAKRSKDSQEDELIKHRLRTDLKEQTENVMIVDLVRNDLTKSAVPESVKVEEQFGIYSFPLVHQMISTISCQLQQDVHFVEAIKNTFPMGSMTGAPKVSAMQLIEKEEVTKRGAYAGALGYFTPKGDFDLNVVIRSILYASDRNYLSFEVGSAITDASLPEKEYEECLLKASAIIHTIKGPH